MVVKTFRGILADDGQDRIRLSTIDGKVGYRIVKFEIVGKNPQVDNHESVVKIYKTEQTSLDGIIDFTDNNLLAAGVYKNYPQAAYTMHDQIVFDTVIVNQDIYVTHTEEAGGTEPCNYYIEMEALPLTSQGAEYTTIKDLRANA